MAMTSHARWSGCLLFLAGGVAAAQSTLPPMSPTFLERAAQKASVQFANGELAVNADNSSLNQILKDVSQKMGLKIVGGVIDERVYGKYGPAAPAKVLASLLDGTSSNMLLAEARKDTPIELILTPRQESITPPRPPAPQGIQNLISSTAEAHVIPAVRPDGSAPVPSELALNAPGQPPATDPAGGTAAEVRATTQEPEGILTPGLVYEQLKRLEQPKTQLASMR